MLIRFSIQNFGSVKDKQTLSFEADKSKHLEDYYVIEINGLRLLKLGLIYGANASGKTTILKALDFLRTLVLEPKMQKSETFDFEPFALEDKTLKQNTIFEIEFLQNGIRYFYEVVLNKNAIIREELYVYNPKKSNVFIRTTDIENQATKIKFGNKIKISNVAHENFENITLWNNTVLGGFSKINFVSQELKDITDWFLNYLSLKESSINQNYIDDEFFKSNRKSILAIIKKADFNISNIIVKPVIPKLNSKNDYPDYHKLNIQDKNALNGWIEYYNDIIKEAASQERDIKFEHSVHNKSYLLDFKQESEGTRRYYTMAGILFLLIKYSRAFIIDELEASLHPDLFQHFLLSFLANTKHSQLLATTHNREILNNKDIFRNDAIWITDKSNADCATELYSLADFDTSVIRDTSNIYNAYKIGKLGGVPNLGDYYIETEEDDEK
jgi:AAA15 family ATPase/GTPase